MLRLRAIHRSPNLLGNFTRRTQPLSSIHVSSTRRHFHGSTAVLDESQPVRTRLTAELKNTMKAKDRFSSNVLRSVLAEIYAADKASTGKADNTAVVSILRKALTRRTDSAAEFRTASRADLAEVETREAKFLSSFLPPSLSETEIDAILSDCVQSIPNFEPSPRAMGPLMKAFYSRVDRSTVDGALVKNRAEHIINSQRSAL